MDTIDRKRRKRMNYHNPVLPDTVINGLNIVPEGTYVDVTYGGGGHSQAILRKLQGGRLLAFDQDDDCQINLINDKRFQFVQANFRYLTKFLQYYKTYPVDGILADLGVSSHQIDTPERGFSYRTDGILDMRMNRQAGLSARDVVNTYDENRLGKIFYNYGELPNGKQLAINIVKARQKQTINTTIQLSEILTPHLTKGKENKFLSKIFQAIRIEVNHEMEVLEEFLLQTADALRTGGRLVVISYHSLEDRIVKNFMRAGNADGEVKKDFYGNPISPFRPVNRKPLIPNKDEIENNPRARSAKLRIAEKITDK